MEVGSSSTIDISGVIDAAATNMTEEGSSVRFEEVKEVGIRSKVDSRYHRTYQTFS